MKKLEIISKTTHTTNKDLHKCLQKYVEVSIALFFLEPTEGKYLNYPIHFELLSVISSFYITNLNNGTKTLKKLFHLSVRVNYIIISVRNAMPDFIYS